jgi:tRNA(Glu) U13 pseudouridine synthase TruD
MDVDVWYDAGLVLAFTLPPGCYATNVLAEVMKTSPEEMGAEQEETGQELSEEEEGEI